MRFCDLRKKAKDMVRKAARSFGVAAVIMLFVLRCASAYAQETPQVQIETGAMSYTEDQFLADVTVTFFDPELYNDQVRLGYHILDDDGSLLAFEGSRLPFTLDEEKTAFLTAVVDLKSMPELADVDTAKVRFDLVDEKNGFWFSQNDEIRFQTAEVRYDRAQLAAMAEEGTAEPAPAENEPVRFQPASLVLNLLAWAALAGLGIFWGRKKMRTQKGNDGGKGENDTPPVPRMRTVRTVAEETPPKKEERERHMEKRSGYDKTIMLLGIGFSALYAVMLFWGVKYVFNSDHFMNDVMVQEVRANGLTAFRDYVTLQRINQYDLAYWIPKLIVNILTNNMLLADRLVSLLFWLVILVALWLAARKLIGKTAAWLTVCIFGCGVSAECMVVFTDNLLQLHLLYMLILLWFVGALLSVKSASKKKKCLICSTAVLYLIYIIAVDQRYAALYSVPVFASVALSYYIDVRKSENILQVFKYPRKKLYILCGLAGGTLLGLAINSYLKKVLPFTKGLTALSAFGFADLTDFFDALAIYVLGILRMWGCDLSAGVSTISPASIGYIVKGCVCVICMVIIPILCAVKYKKLPEGMKLLVGAYFVLSIELFYVYVLSSLNTMFVTRYFTYELPLAIMISAWYLRERVLKAPNLDRLVLVCCLVVFCLGSEFTIFKCMQTLKQSGAYQEREELIETVEEDGAVYGYASYWNGQILTTMSNNKIKVRPLTLAGDIYPFFTINYIHYFEEGNYDGETFLLLTAAERLNILDNSPTLLTQLGEPLRVLTSGQYYVYVYDHNIAADLYNFPYNGGYIPLTGSYEESGIVLHEDACEQADVGGLNVAVFPITIEPNSWYKLSFHADTDVTPSLFYADFYGQDYDFSEQDTAIAVTAGGHDYEAIIRSGALGDSGERDISLRLISIPGDPISITDLSLAELEMISID